MGCTTGAKVLRKGQEFLLFKNRDFTRMHFDDRFTLTERAFGVDGVETWDSDDPSKDRFSGFTIGFNAHLACCDSNVKGIPGAENYDKLVQEVVENCTTIEQAVEHVGDLVSRRAFSWCNMLVASADGVAAMEVRERHVEVEYNPVFVARANHHICLGANPDDDDHITSAFRYRTAYDKLAATTRLDDVFPILRAHHLTARYGVCNHGMYETVCSYIIHWNEGATTFYVLQGHPCDGGEFVKLPIAFGQANDLSRYPSQYALVSR